ncbi:hypothetical protein [Nocardia higoensis]|uniref:hypothetical protein n=1 Tax=Nocardia higoensis TaxID=228599 RepID=UPI0002DA5BD7|nr:hypothetical protein [Nocardia higoensis]
MESGSIDGAMYLRARTNEEAISVAKNALAQAIHNSGGPSDWAERAEDALRDEQYEAHVRRADLLIA